MAGNSILLQLSTRNLNLHFDKYLKELFGAGGGDALCQGVSNMFFIAFEFRLKPRMEQALEVGMTEDNALLVDIFELTDEEWENKMEEWS